MSAGATPLQTKTDAYGNTLVFDPVRGAWMQLSSYQALNPASAAGSPGMTQSGAPAGTAPTMDPALQQKLFGFTSPALPPYHLDGAIDSALDSVRAGISPRDFGVLDLWTGAVHFQYQLPNGTIPHVGYTWVLKTDGTWAWQSGPPDNSNFDLTAPPSWAPKPPDVKAYTSGAITQPRMSADGSTAPPPSLVTQSQTASSANPTPAAVPADVAKALAAAVPPKQGGGPGTTAPPQTLTGGEDPGGKTGMSVSDQIIARANGSNMGKPTDSVSVLLNWDEWGFYYNSVTQNKAPAPEDVGIKRNSSGQVVLNGQTTYDYNVWSAAAFPPAPPSGGSGGSGGSWVKGLIAGYAGYSAA